MNIGNKINELRKEKGLTQDILAEQFSVSVDTIEKWETENEYPDITLIPAIAAFFNISINELFDYDMSNVENEITKIVSDSAALRESNPEKSEQILREALTRYPNNEILLNNLLYVLSGTKTKEKIDIAKRLIQNTHDDEIKYDAIRILAKTYYELDNSEMVEYYLEQIPEIYFTKLELDALYLKGEDKKRAAKLHLLISIEQSIEMISCLIDIAKENNDTRLVEAEYNRGLNILNDMCNSEADESEKLKDAIIELREHFIKNNSFKRF